MKTFATLNDRIAISATRWLGSMTCAYAFITLALMPLWWPTQRDLLLYVSNSFQLVSLPLLAVGTALVGRNAETRAQQDHEAIMTELDLLKRLHHDVHEAMGLREGL